MSASMPPAEATVFLFDAFTHLWWREKRQGFRELEPFRSSHTKELEPLRSFHTRQPWDSRTWSSIVASFTQLIRNPSGLIPPATCGVASGPP
jgi:hypothetical protein